MAKAAKKFNYQNVPNQKSAQGQQPIITMSSPEKIGNIMIIGKIDVDRKNSTAIATKGIPNKIQNQKKITGSKVNDDNIDSGEPLI